MHVILQSSVEVAAGPNSTLRQEKLALWFYAELLMNLFRDFLGK